MQAFVDSRDPRDAGTAAYGAAQEGALGALRLLHATGPSQEDLSPALADEALGELVLEGFGIPACWRRWPRRGQTRPAAPR